MVKTYREVLQDIRPGETWECIESDSIIRAIRYYEDEAIEMATAIDDLCSPKDNYGWASAGIYCFWDYYDENKNYLSIAPTKL